MLSLSGDLRMDSGELANFASGENSVGGDLSVTAQSLLLNNDAEITASPRGGASGGDITVSVHDTVSLEAGSRIVAEVNNADAGSISLSAEQINISGNSLLSNNAFDEGLQGSISIAAHDLTLSDAGTIAARNTHAAGGDLNISLSGTLLVDGESDIATDTFGRGQGGDLTIGANNVIVKNGSIISIGTRGAGDSGALNITATDNLTVSGRSERFESALLSRTGDPNLNAILGDNPEFGTGDGGRIVISASSAIVENNAIISSQASKSGNAGSISITAEALTVDQSTIETEALASAGGNIELSVSRDLIINNSEITAAAGGVSTSDAGGNITVNRPDVLLLNQANIFANANAGNGGNITVASGGFIKSPDSITDASSNKSEPGEISVRGLTNNVTALESLSADYADVSSLLSQICAQSLKSRSTFVVEGGLSKNKVPSIYGRAASAEAAASTAMRQKGAAVAGVGQSGEALLSDLIAQACPN